MDIEKDKKILLIGASGLVGGLIAKFCEEKKYHQIQINRTSLCNKSDLIEEIVTDFNDNKYFGVGPNNFRHSCENLKYKAKSINHYNCYNHPHNLFIQILAECGIFVFLLLLLFYLYLIKYYFTFLKSYLKNLNNLDLKYENWWNYKYL